MAESVRGVSALQTELEKAKESLKDVDENIKKLTGRDPTIQRVPQRRVALGATERGGRKPGAESRLFNLARRGIIQDETSPSPQKRAARVGGAFSRLGPLPPGRERRRGRGQDSGDEDDLHHKPSLQSSVHATSREERSRQNSIEEQSKDRKGQARNRRMFGLLLGTLQKFKDDAAVSKDKEEQRQKIEKKLDEKFKQEKEEIVQERRNLFVERRRKQFKIRLLEQKMEMAQNHDDWERETKKLENFIITKAKPCLFYLPKIITADTETKLADTREAIKGMIEMRRRKLEEEISAMMSQVHDDGGIGDGEDQGESGDEMESEEERLDDKENEEREERDREGRGDVKVELEVERVEREKRDREREQKDRDRQQRERKGREYRGRSKDKSRSRERSNQRDQSGGRRESEKDRDRSARKGRSRSEKSKSRERDRHRSGKHRSERKRDNSEEEKSRGEHRHSSRSKRRSKGEGRGEKREKVWEPMEDEVEEEFVGSRDSEKVSIASKMLQMAGMAEAVQEAKTVEEQRQENETEISAGDIQDVSNISAPDSADMPVSDDDIHVATTEQTLVSEAQIEPTQS